jgi:signal peptidase I
MNEDSTNNRPKSFFESWTFIIVICVILPICFRTVLYSPRHIPSSSMKSTLLIGDYIFISKFAYGFSRYSFPLGYKIKYFAGRKGGDKPKRGDVIVFRPNNDPSTDFIKRLVGMPGESIQMRGGRLYINGAAIEQKRVEDFLEEKEDGSVYPVKRYVETLPNGVAHEVLDEVENGPGDDTKEFIVPADSYFFMGDNRDNSADSRFGVGFVPEENLVGKAEMVMFSNRSKFLRLWNWVVSFRDERFFIDLTKND